MNTKRLPITIRLKSVETSFGVFALPIPRFLKGLASDDSPLVLRDVGNQEIYALDLQLP